MSSSIGNIFRLTTFGESHGKAIGGVIDGVPSGFTIVLEEVQRELNRRKPGQSSITTQRKESDKVEFLSGLFEGKTTGAPIGFIIPNENQKTEDYQHLKNVYRPSHADYTYDKKYGIRDFRGGGRSSARTTASCVVAGAIAKQILKAKGIDFITYVDQIGILKLEGYPVDINVIEKNKVRCPNMELAEQMEAYIKQIRSEGDTVGGSVFCSIQNLPAGLGEPMFDKFQAELAKAMLSINAVKGFEYGSGFSSITMRGSEHNDLFNEDGTTKSNFSGGIQGGITNGMPVKFRVAFKPVATLMNAQEMLSDKGELIRIKGKGRHDPCVVPRAVVIVESMAAIVTLDMFLRARLF